MSLTLDAIHKYPLMEQGYLVGLIRRLSWVNDNEEAWTAMAQQVCDHGVSGGLEYIREQARAIGHPAEAELAELLHSNGF